MLPKGGVVGGEVVSGEVETGVLDPSESSGTAWLEKNAGRELAKIAKLASSGRYPDLTKDFAKALVGYEAAKLRAVGSVKAAEAAAAGKAKGVDPLVLAAQRVMEMDEAELMAAAGEGFAIDPEEE